MARERNPGAAALGFSGVASTLSHFSIMQIIDTFDNLSAALEAVSEALTALETGATDLTLGVDRVRHELREALVAANGVSATCVSSVPHSQINKVRAAVDVGAVRALLQSAAISWGASTARSGEGYLSRVVAATSGVRTILEVAVSTLRNVQENVRPDGRDLERDWSLPA